MPEHTDSILITGGTGMVGQAIVEQITRTSPHRPLHLLSRTPGRIGQRHSTVRGFFWDPEKGNLDPAALEGVSHVVHLAGEPVAQRWTAAAKQRIRTSRIDTLDLLRAHCEQQGLAPRILSASAIGWYAQGPEWRTESDPAGTGFLSAVVQDWEAAAARFGSLGGGHVQFRIGLVLARHGGVLKQLMPLYRWGLGAPLAQGDQWQSWIHLDDLSRLFLSALMDDSWSGPYNAVAPQPVSQRAFSQALATSLGRPHFLPAVPAWAIRLRFGSAAQALLASHRIRPERVMNLPFAYRFATLGAALEAIASSD